MCFVFISRVTGKAYVNNIFCKSVKLCFVLSMKLAFGNIRYNYTVLGLQFTVLGIYGRNVQMNAKASGERAFLKGHSEKIQRMCFISEHTLYH